MTYRSTTEKYLETGLARVKLVVVELDRSARSGIASPSLLFQRINAPTTHNEFSSLSLPE